MNLLFVCTANISRSFFAEKLFVHQSDADQINGVTVRSAGVRGIPGGSADPAMMEQLEDLGIGPVEHESTQLTQELVAWADLILVMEYSHLQNIALNWPEVTEKVELLGKYITEGGYEEEISDPYGRSSFHYRVCRNQITMAIDGLIKRRVLNI